MNLQDYSPQPEIKGVSVLTPIAHKDDGGELREIFVRTDAFAQTLQVNHSVIEPGAVKAFHLHKEQTDTWYVLGKAIVVLFDTREMTVPGSQWGNTYKKCPRNRLVLENQIVIIPPGVAHGIGNPYSSRLHMIYFADKFFNPKDEFRIAYDALGADIWNIQKG